MKERIQQEKTILKKVKRLLKKRRFEEALKWLLSLEVSLQHAHPIALSIAYLWIKLGRSQNASAILRNVLEHDFYQFNALFLLAYLDLMALKEKKIILKLTKMLNTSYRKKVKHILTSLKTEGVEGVLKKLSVDYFFEMPKVYIEKPKKKKKTKKKWTFGFKKSGGFYGILWRKKGLIEVILLESFLVVKENFLNVERSKTKE